MMRLVLAALLVAAPAAAKVIGGGITAQTGDGRFVVLQPEDILAVGEDTFDRDDLFAFDEDQNIRLTRAIRPDIGGLIPAETVVASHYVFFDSVRGVHEGYVDFDAPILGVATSRQALDATDFLANTEVLYLSSELRGLEAGDRVWVDPDDPFRLRVAWAGSSPGDYVRVFTARSPGM